MAQVMSSGVLLFWALDILFKAYKMRSDHYENENQRGMAAYNYTFL